MSSNVWRVVRWVGGPIVVIGLCAAVWMILTYFKAQRFAACNDLGGFWDDEQRICYFLRCQGRPNEKRVDLPGSWQCAIKLN